MTIDEQHLTYTRTLDLFRFATLAYREKSCFDKDNRRKREVKHGA